MHYLSPYLVDTVIRSTPLHIPDGYLSPLTALVFYLLVIPFWYIAGRRAQRRLTGRMVPLVALLAAFSFVIMMFNVPLPGGTTGHAVGASLAAIGGGGRGSPAWRSPSPCSSRRSFLATAGSSRLGQTASTWPSSSRSFRTPSTAQSPAKVRSPIAGALWPRSSVATSASAWRRSWQGSSLACNRCSSMPRMARRSTLPSRLAFLCPPCSSHTWLWPLLSRGLATALIVRYLQQANPGLLAFTEPVVAGVSTARRRATRALWVGLGLLAVLSPVGLLATGTAWGEWSASELAAKQGFVPQGIAAGGRLWSAPLSGYTLTMADDRLAYIASAFIGVAVAFAAIWLVWRLLFDRRPGIEGLK